MGGREKSDQQPTGFAALLKSLREDAGMSQQDLAVAAKMSIGGYQKLEQGSREPAWPTVLALADALHVSPEVFVPPPMKVRHDPTAESKTPIICEVPAGRPAAVEELATEWIDLGEMFQEEGLVAYRVRGLSMVEAQIGDGDLAIVRPQPEAEHGEIVVATINGELTLKVLRRFNGCWCLFPKNRESKVPYIELDKADDPRILGVYVGKMGRTHKAGRRKK